MLEIDIQNTLSELTRSIGRNATDIAPIAASGSSRRYYRITTDKGSLIGTYNANIEENEAFFYLTLHFKKKEFPVPDLFAVNEHRDCYLQSDQGDVTLFQFVQQSLLSGKYDDQTIDLFHKTLEQLVQFQIKGHPGLDYSKVYPTPCFDNGSVMDDLDYFKYYFVKPHAEIVFNEQRLKAEFKDFANFVCEAYHEAFMYRDFQSRNVMVYQGEPVFIDYQGGRQGPLQYDVVSLLFQVKAQMPQPLRDQLLLHYKEALAQYLDLEAIAFDKYYPYFVYLRLLQVLGAYGFRGLIQKKTHFIESIPYALKELSAWTESHPLAGYPELESVIKQVISLLPKYDPTLNSQRSAFSSTLTVTVNSF